MPRKKLSTSDFDYPVPQELIAHHPAARREQSRLMILDRESKTIEHKVFSNIINYLKPSDLLVLNDTKVIPAKLIGKKCRDNPCGCSARHMPAKIDVLLLKQKEKDVWETLVKPGKRLKPGHKIVFGDGEMIGEVMEKNAEGIFLIQFSSEEDFAQILARLGEVPLPPYIKMTNDKLKMSNEGNNPEFNLRQRYQTVYAEKEGASAAPTAGLHFSEELLEKIKEKGVEVCNITLHTGLATFRPVFAEDIKDHNMHSEYLDVSKEVSKQILKAKKEGRRVVAVGTTVVRALETVGNSPSRSPSLSKRGGRKGGELKGGFKGETNLFIYPGYKFKVVDALITNFHWPRSTLIMLVSAFAGRDFIFQAYEEAIKQRYRFYSFGDAMLIV